MDKETEQVLERARKSVRGRYGADMVAMTVGDVCELIAALERPEHPVGSAAVSEPLGLLIRGQGGAFRVQTHPDAIKAIYDMPPGEHGLYAIAAQPAVAPSDSAKPAGEQKGWVDEFGNVFPMGAWKPAKATYHDDHKRAWKPLYLAAAPTPDSKGAAEPT